MCPDFHTTPDTYLERAREAVPLYDELQAQAIAAVPFAPARVLELGMGTGETTRRLIEAFPDSWVIGLDSSPDMVFYARAEYDDVQLARMEDPLPDGPWDLVIAVLSLHHLTDDQKHTLFRRVREHSRSLVIGDIVRAEPQVTQLHAENAYDSAEDLADWCDGEVVWTEGDLAVVRATYD